MTCDRKRYPSREAADAAASAEPLETAFYQCPACGGAWHTTPAYRVRRWRPGDEDE